jgi:hydrogenase expression/formation protein HypC
MCLAVPLKIVSVNHLLAIAEAYGVQKQVSLFLLPEEARVGDYVLVHAGFAIQKIDEEAASQTLDLLKKLAEQLEMDAESS